MESKPFGGFSLKATLVNTATDSEEKKTKQEGEPELNTMIEEEPEYPDVKTTLDEI